MSELIVIADDLTGAVDTGVQFVKHGIATVVTGIEYLRECSLWSDFSVIVVNTESRHSSLCESASIVRTVSEEAIRRGVRWFYKKSDSTLRGNIGSEIDALMKAARHDRMMFIPAFPDAGRTVIDGFLFVNGVPLQETSYANDPLNPVRSNFIPDILRGQTDFNLHLVPVAALGKGGGELLEKKGIFIFDAAGNDDLNRIREFLEKNSLLHFCAGPAVFASLIAQSAALNRREADCYEPVSPLLIVNGSLNEVSLEQLHCAAKKGVKCFKADILDLHGELNSRSVEQIRRELMEHRTVILTSALEPGDALSGEGIFRRVGEVFGYLTKKIIEHRGDVTVAVFGGDTASAVSLALRLNYVVPVSEISPGLTFCMGSTGEQKIPFISKSGGFGGREIISELQVFVSEGQRAEDRLQVK